MKQAILAAAACIALGGCANASNNIASADISPAEFATYSCPQLVAESQRIGNRVVQLGGRLDKAASNDRAMTGVAVVLFWPALLVVGGTGQQEAEYARMKGEYAAIRQAAALKQCAAFVVAAQ
jgi:hypothetical protein